MPVNLSIKNVPDELAERLRERARRANRSLQGELVTILEEAVGARAPITPLQLLRELEELGVESPADSVAIIREDRDRR